MVRRGLVATTRGLILSEAPYGPTEIWCDDIGRTKAAAASAAASLAPIEIPDWLTALAATEPEPGPPIRPSSALAAADRLTRPGDGPYAPEARLRGTLVHALLERLPAIAAAQRESVARAFVAARAPRIDPDKRAHIVADALGVLANEALAPLFGPASRAEAAIAGRLRLHGADRPVSGQIDRLAVVDGEVLLADYKTTARPPRAGDPLPPAYVAQLALYRALLQEIYPSRRVRAFLIWTSGPMVRELTEAELEAALSAIKAP
jgi:ATP-dependent helicase/nuclease subunit A